MPEELVMLLGSAHQEPSEFEVKEVSPDIVLGISAVVNKRMLKDGGVNNEDACGVYIDEKAGRLVTMVADGNCGFVVSHAAVMRFPEVLNAHLIPEIRSPEDIMQAYLDAIVDFYNQIRTHSQTSSASTFHSVIMVDGGYYALPCCDSFTAVVRDKEVKIVKPVCKYDIGHTDLRQIVKEEVFGLQKKRDDLYDLLNERLEKEEYGTENFRRINEEYDIAMKSLGKELGDMPYPDMRYDQDYIQRIIPVHKLDVRPEDIIFQCTDGIDLNEKGDRKTVAVKYIVKALASKPLYDAIYQIFEGIQKEEFDIEGDNVAIAAVRVR